MNVLRKKICFGHYSNTSALIWLGRCVGTGLQALACFILPVSNEAAHCTQAATDPVYIYAWLRNPCGRK